MKRLLLVAGLLTAPGAANAVEIPELTEQLRDEIHLIVEGLKQVDQNTGLTYEELMARPTYAADYGFESFNLRLLGKVKFSAFGFGFAVKPHIQVGIKI